MNKLYIYENRFKLYFINIYKLPTKNHIILKNGFTFKFNTRNK